MNVSHFNSFLRGGASTAAQRLHRGLLDQGVDSRFQFLAGERPPENDEAAAFHPTRWNTGSGVGRAIRSIRFRLHRERFKRVAQKKHRGAEIFTSPHGQPLTPWPPLGHPAGDTRSQAMHVIHLHWISKFIDVPSFFGSLPQKQPVVWTLHDMNVLTGGCHFAGGCQRFRIGCGNCPQLRRPHQRDVSFQAFETKRRALEGVNLHVVAPSRWLLDLARCSPLLGQSRSFTRIPYGLPTSKLYPMETGFAREALGLPRDRFLIGFGAMSLDNRRKGTAELLSALERLGSQSNLSCLVFGSGTLPRTSKRLPPLIEVGHIRDDRTRRLVYSAADVFVLPSTEDNLPLTGLESMACGTPVVGFSAGGIPDYVLPGKTGWLAENGNAEHLAQRLLTAARNPAALREMGARARNWIQEEFRAELEAKRYIQLYDQILGEAGRDTVDRVTIDRVTVDRAAHRAA